MSMMSVDANDSNVNDGHANNGNNDSLKTCIKVPFNSLREAEIVYNSLRVDPEPIRGSVEKVFKLNAENLIIELSAKNAKQMRVSLNNIFDLLLLVIETIERFDVKKE